MGKQAHLSDVEIVKAKMLLDQGKSVSAVSRELGRSRKAIYNANARNFEPAVRKGGRKKKIGSRMMRRICKYLLRNTVTSLKQIIDALDLRCTKSTLQRTLRYGKIASYTSPKKVPRLSDSHKKARIDWAKEHCDVDWTSVVFSDEKRFCLASDSYLRYWHCKSESSRRIVERYQGCLSGGLMVWLGVGYNGLLPLKIFDTGERVNSQAYQDMLEECLVPYMREELTFQQDNCAVHVSRSTKAWLASKNISLLAWPSRSPDLNIVENIWDNMSKRMYSGGKVYRNVSELRIAINEAYESIPDSLLLSLYSSIPRRLMSLAERKGNTINY